MNETMTMPARQAPANLPAKPKSVSILRTRLEGPQFAAELARVLPKHLTPERFVRVAVTTVMRTPLLAECDQVSFFNALLNLSQLGLEPDGRRAHLIPFWNSKRNTHEVQLIIDYKGLAELVYRSGAVSYLHADVVCESDEFDYDRGQIIKHRIDFRQARGKPYAAYALCRFKDGSEKCEVLSVQEVESVRARSKAGRNGPWVTDWSEMAKKTAFRRLSKWLPLSPEYRDAIEKDDDVLPALVQAPRLAEDLKPHLAAPTAKPMLEPGLPDLRQPEPAEAAEEPDDLAPVTAAPDATEPSAPTPQQQLASLLHAKGHTFDDLVRWGVDQGQLPDATSYAGFDDLPDDAATRLIESSKGLLTALAFDKRSRGKQ